MRTLGLDRRDGRNLLLVVAIVAIVVAGIGEGSTAVRLVAGALAGVISAVAFLLSTLVINRYKPDHW